MVVYLSTISHNFLKKNIFESPKLKKIFCKNTINVRNLEKPERLLCLLVKQAMFVLVSDTSSEMSSLSISHLFHVAEIYRTTITICKHVFQYFY